LWKASFNPSQRIAAGYFLIAFIGSLLLLLPWSRHGTVGFTNAFFTSISALCVTGLSTLNTATTWTPFGDVVIAVLMQIGGAGITLLTTSLYLALGRKISLRNRILIAEDRNFGIRGSVRLIKSILFFSFSTEGAAAVLFALYFHFRYHYSWVRAIGISTFHAISAFNNAGFDLWGNSLESFATDPFVIILTGILIIIGGLGFIVLVELTNFRHTHHLSLHSRIVLWMTGVLIIVGTVLILFFEAGHSMAHLSWGNKILNAWFSSVTTRTAGFDSISISKMKEVTWFIMILLMFIGASPGSTGGGIKTTTFYTLIKGALTSLRGENDIVVGQRSIPWDVSQRALLIFFLGIGVVAMGTLVDAALEPHIRLMRLAFEQVSAFGTVGLSTGITGHVVDGVKWVLIVTMFIGRVGIITLLIGILQKRTASKVKRIQERIFIG
jgi:trk system potassium uptake protein TrkH